jgi:hypothetical protein
MWGKIDYYSQESLTQRRRDAEELGGLKRSCTMSENAIESQKFD